MLPIDPSPFSLGIAAAVAFALGSVPAGLLIARRHGIDIREHGSGNIGATNVGRVVGRRAGILCFAIDVTKGLVPTLGAGLVFGWLEASGSHALTDASAWAWLGLMSMPVFGHVFSPWVRFRGGKGVATGLGSMLGLFPVLTLSAIGALLVWIVTVKLTRFVGVASCLAAASLPALSWLVIRAGTSDEGDASRAWVPFVVVTGVLALLVVIRHRGNLWRTLKGTEPRVGEPKPDDAA